MPSLGQALSAVIAHATTAEVEGERQFAVFPNFFFPIDGSGLAGGKDTAAFNFALRANMVPLDPPRFPFTTDLVWDVYEDVLEHRRLPSSADPQAGYASRFAKARAKLRISELQPPGGARYFATVASPTDVGPGAGWTKVKVGSDEIASEAAGLGTTIQDWLKRFNTLPVLGEAFIDSMQFERLTLLILRPWLEDDLLKERFWDLDGAPISDGGEPPKGRMPGIPVKLVLLQNFIVKLAPVRMPDIGPTVMYRRTGGADAIEEAPPAAQLEVLSGANHRPFVLARPLSLEGGPVAEQIANLKAELLAATGADQELPDPGPTGTTVSGGQRFHVPFKFDCTAAREVAQGELAQAEAALQQKSAQREELTRSLDELREEIASLGNPHGVWGMVKKLQIQKLQMSLAVVSQSEAQVDQELGEAQREHLRCTRAIQLLDQLDAMTVPSGPFTLMIVCDRVPKAPNPDTNLFKT
jgi:hypothetical protein